MRIDSRFFILPLCLKLRLVTKGNVLSSAPLYYDLDANIARFLATAESLTLFRLVEGPSTYFRAYLCFRTGFDRNNVGASPIQIGATVPATGGATESKRHTPYATVADFQLWGRPQIAYGNADGQSTVENGVVSMALGVLTVGR